MQQETASQKIKTGSYPRKWLVVVIWIVSSIAIIGAVVVESLEAWLRISGRDASNLGLGLSFDLFFLILVAFWASAIPATVLLIGLWASIKAPPKAKRSGTVAVALAWLGILIVILKP